MSERPTIRLRGALAGSVLALATHAALACESDRPVHIVADDQPLAEIVETIALVCDIDVVSAAPLTARTSAAYDSPAGETLRRVLRQYNYVLQVDASGRPLRLRIFGKEAPVRIGGDDRLAKYRRGLSDADPDARIDAVLALADFDGSDAGRALLSLSLQDPDAGVRDAAEAALDALGDSP